MQATTVVLLFFGSISFANLVHLPVMTMTNQILHLVLGKRLSISIRTYLKGSSGKTVQPVVVSLHVHGSVHMAEIKDRGVTIIGKVRTVQLYCHRVVQLTLVPMFSY